MSSPQIRVDLHAIDDTYDSRKKIRARLLSRNDEMHIVAKMNFKEFCYKGSNKSRLIFMNYV
ncbi:hypothetical protein T4D_919 [Trichinella pseudospiralis]|uniref:Uncharacterized protein n=1 Tax=Trichinella pseudospiralis TaxID=6337 RepID=A0A0V1FS57_TRIPS|nr:hypothetical protein T4D_919 [Trichinella pseudospiralis]